MLLKKVKEDFVPLEVFKLFNVKDISSVFFLGERIFRSVSNTFLYVGAILHVNALRYELVKVLVVRLGPYPDDVFLVGFDRVYVLLCGILDVNLLQDAIHLLRLHALLLFSRESFDFFSLGNCLLQTACLVRYLIKRLIVQLSCHCFAVLLEEIACDVVIKLDFVELVLGQSNVEDVEDLEKVLCAVDCDQVHRQQVLVEAVLVFVAHAGFPLHLALHVLAKSSSTEDLLSVWSASNFCLEQIKQLVPKVLLV